MELAKFTLINTTKTTLGPASLIQYLQSKEIEVNCIYAPKNNNDLYTKDELVTISKEIEHCEIVGFSSYSISELRTLQLMRYIKDKYPLKHQVLGGPNAILDPERLINEYGVDSVCIHEGEIPLERLIKRYHEGNFFDILGLWFKDGNLIIKNSLQKPVQNIDEIPFTNYKRNYKKLGTQGLVLEKNMAENIENPFMLGNFLYVTASRGCPNSCSYCINDSLNNIAKTIHGKKIRKKSNLKLIAEIKEVIRNEDNVSALFFFDDDFFVKTESELEEFAKEYKHVIRLPYHILANPDSTTKKKLDLCFYSGLVNIELGLQSVSDNVLKKYNRRNNAKKIRDILQYVNDKKFNITVGIDFITNSPFESNQDIIDNVKYVLDLPGTFLLHIHNLHLFPGSKLRTEFASGTGSENREFQDNIIVGKVFNEYLSKLLMAMQGFHTAILPERFGALTRSEIIYFIETMSEQYENNLKILNDKIKETDVAKYYSQYQS